MKLMATFAFLFLVAAVQVDAFIYGRLDAQASFYGS